MRKNEHASIYKIDYQIRRPLAVRIAQDLRLQHPSWAEDDIVAEATTQTLAQLQGKERMAA